MKKIFLLILALSPLSADLLTEAKATHSQNFVMATVPKAGTHLLIKLFQLLQDKERTEVRLSLGIPSWNNFTYTRNSSALVSTLEKFLDNTHYLYCHSDYCYLVTQLLKKHPELPLIVGLRDLRDILVSQVFYQWDLIEKMIGVSSFDEKLLFLMKNDDIQLHPHLLVVHRHATAMLPLLDLKQTLIVRFEDIVGSQGGGSDELQYQLISDIASHIGLSLSQDKIAAIQAVLFGDEFIPSINFRSGQIGSWKDHFSPENLDFFNKKFGRLQKAFGYR